MTVHPIPIGAAGRLSLVTCPRPATFVGDIADLVSAQVTMVVSALPEDDEADLGLHEESSALARHGIDFLRIPIEDFDVPADADVTVAALGDVLARLTDPAQHVAMHCLGGLGRSPLLAASLLVMSGEEPESAWRIVATARRRTVPETPEQRAWVGRLAPVSAHATPACPTSSTLEDVEHTTLSRLDELISTTEETLRNEMGAVTSCQIHKDGRVTGGTKYLEGKLVGLTRLRRVVTEAAEDDVREALRAELTAWEAEWRLRTEAPHPSPPWVAYATGGLDGVREAAGLFAPS